MENLPENIQEMLKYLQFQHQQNAKWSTVSLYGFVLKSVNAFTQHAILRYDDITAAWLKSFENHLRASGCKWNTISTYIRILRTAYNRAVEQGSAPQRPYIFNKVYVGVEADRENALEADDMALLIDIAHRGTDKLTTAELRSLRKFVLMFYLRGLPFVDLVFLKKSELRGNLLTYRRRKTGSYMVVEVLEDAAQLISCLRCNDPTSPYLFPIIHHLDGTEEAYKDYRFAIRNFNKRLVHISQKLELHHKLSSYTARHTWATMAYYCEVSPGIISQAMGHSSIKITETYLKPFQNRIIHQANKQVINFVTGGK